MTTIDHCLDDFASMLGVTIEYTTDLPPDRDAEYDHELKVIRILPDLHARHHRSVLAHELCHAIYGDVPSPFGPVNAKQERRAEEWAALRLIRLDDYRRAEAIHRGHAGAMAVELGVMRSIVIAFRSLLERFGDTTYFQPRMGPGQWLHRIEVS